MFYTLCDSDVNILHAKMIIYTSVTKTVSRAGMFEMCYTYRWSKSSQLCI